MSFIFNRRIQSFVCFGKGNEFLNFILSIRLNSKIEMKICFGECPQTVDQSGNVRLLRDIYSPGCPKIHKIPIPNKNIILNLLQITRYTRSYATMLPFLYNIYQ